jgi:hypothetical protein
LMKEMKTYRVLEKERAMNEEIKSMIVDALWKQVLSSVWESSVYFYNKITKKIWNYIIPVNR